MKLVNYLLKNKINCSKTTFLGQVHKNENFIIDYENVEDVHDVWMRKFFESV